MIRLTPGRSPATRYLVGAVAFPVALLLFGVCALLGPWSPLALDRANARYTAGDIAGASAAYAAVAEGWHFPDTRAEAAVRAGLLAAVSGEDLAAATWLRRAVDLHSDAQRRAAIRAQLAAVYLDALGDPVRAAQELEQAAVEAPAVGVPVSSVVAARMWAGAARAWERGHHPEQALAAWTSAAAGAPDAVLGAEIDAGLARAEAAFGGVADAGL